MSKACDSQQKRNVGSTEHSMLVSKAAEEEDNRISTLSECERGRHRHAEAQIYRTWPIPLENSKSRLSARRRLCARPMLCQRMLYFHVTSVLTAQPPAMLATMPPEIMAGRTPLVLRKIAPLIPPAATEFSASCLPL